MSYVSCLRPVDSGGGAAASVALGRFWVPRIRVLFGAEDPRVFAERVQAAQRARETAEAAVLYRLSVARMPVWTGPGGTARLDAGTLQRIQGHALSTPGLRGGKT